jgi:subtilisin family serine protease
MSWLILSQGTNTVRKLILKLAFVFALAVVVCTGSAAAQQRYIVRTTGGFLSVLRLCSAAGCQVQGSLDGNVGQTYLVTSTQNLLTTLLSIPMNLLEAILGIQSVEQDRVLPLPQVSAQQPGYGLSDSSPVNYYGSVVWHGYAAQPATYIIRLRDAQSGFGVSGTGTVAVIDTGVDPNHPALVPVLVPGYDFTRNQAGANEWLDVTGMETGMENGPVDQDSQNQQPVIVQQSTAAVLDQSTAAVLDGSPYIAFGHGTMTSGLIHLVAPKAKILPLKAFSSNGTGNLSNIIAALYYAKQHGANVVNMSFDLSVPSPALSYTVSQMTQSGIVLVAAAGNENTSARVYPASLNGNVVGVASTTDYDTRSSFSNYGNADVWVAAPGENIISTYPGGTYGSSSGTSFSSPIVAGTVALAMSLKPGLNQSKAANALSHARTLTPDLNHGRLDVYQTLTAWQVSW